MTTPLRIAREKQGKTIVEVSTAIGIDPGNLSRIERGAQVPSKALAEQLAQYFGDGLTELHIIYPERFTPRTATSRAA